LNVDFSTAQRPVYGEVREYFRRNGKMLKVNEQDFKDIIRALNVCPVTIRLPENNLKYFMEVYGRLYGATKAADIPEEAMVSMIQYLLQRGLKGFNVEAHQAEAKAYGETVGKAVKDETIQVKSTEIRFLQEDLSKHAQALSRYKQDLKVIEAQGG